MPLASAIALHGRPERAPRCRSACRPAARCRSCAADSTVQDRGWGSGRGRSGHGRRGWSIRRGSRRSAKAPATRTATARVVGARGRRDRRDGRRRTAPATAMAVVRAITSTRNATTMRPTAAPDHPLVPWRPAASPARPRDDSRTSGVDRTGGPEQGFIRRSRVPSAESSARAGRRPCRQEGDAGRVYSRQAQLSLLRKH